MQIDINDLTLDEIEKIEDRTGVAFNLIQERSIAKLARGIAFVSLLRGDSGLADDEAWMQAGSVKMADAVAMISDDEVEELDPTNAAS